MTSFWIIITVSATILGQSYGEFLASRYFHDYVKEGRPVDGPFPSSLINIPYFCYQAPSKGPCGGMFLVWFFDVVTRQCEKMMYSGCGGNENMFNTQGECNHYCGRTRKV